MNLKLKYPIICLIAIPILFLVYQGFSMSDSKPLMPDPKDRICPKSQDMVRGMDIYEADKFMDWPHISKYQIKFIFIKATEGNNFVSKKYASQRDNALTTKIKYSAYHFFDPKNDPHEQAQLFLQTVGEFDHQNLPPTLDWEDHGGMPIKTQIERAKIWLDEVEKASGTKPCIYTSYSFFNELGNPKEFADYPLYIANYGATCPKVPPVWDKWYFWQVSKNDGENPDLDLFNGNEEDLKMFIENAWKNKVSEIKK